MRTNHSTKLIASLALAVLMLWSSACMSGSMESDAQSVTGAEFAKMTAHSSVKVVLEISDVKSGLVEGTILDPSGTNTYARSTTPVTIRFDSSTQIVMGGAAEIRTGAVIHSSGVLATGRTIQARQIVILTGYVKVK